MKLRIAPGFAFPLDVVTESIAILAKRGAGKTYAASVLVEEMLDAGLQVVVVDPIGAWWGLRSSADGKGAGFAVPILGGEHGDVPLQATGGQVVADLVVDERVSAIVDLSAFSKNDWRRFVGDFIARLYQRNREAMHVVLEEADLFAPEGKLKRAGDEQMLGAIYDLVRRGRSKGLGSTLITQRSASISKEVLTQAEILIALRTTGPHDRRAIDEWVRVHAEALDVDSLASLPTGEAWVSWPVEGILKRVKIRPRRTFDSSATPKPGQVRRQPKTLADVDLQAFRKRMAETIERAKADDPKELRRRVAELERQLATTSRVSAPAEVVVERVEVPVFSDGEVEFLAETVGGLNATVGLLGREGARLSDLSSALGTAAIRIERALEGWTKRTLTGPQTGAAHHAGVRAPARPRASPEGAGRGGPIERKTGGGSVRDRPLPAPDSARITEVGELTGPARKILDSIAWWEMVGYPKPTKQQVGIIAGYRVGKRVGGHYGNTLGALRSAGLIEYPDAGRVMLTDDGRQYADVADLAPTTIALQEQVLARLSEPEGRILKALVDVYPEALPKQELGARAGYEVGDRVGGHFGNLLGRLRTLGLIDYPSPGAAAADPVLFLEER